MVDYLENGTDVSTVSARELAIRAVNHAMIAQALAETNARLIAENSRRLEEMSADSARLREADLRLAESLGGIGRELGEIRTILQDIVRMVVGRNGAQP